MKHKLFAIVNDIIFPEALNTLERIATPILFSSKDIAYPSLAGHIDVFFVSTQQVVNSGTQYSIALPIAVRQI